MYFFSFQMPKMDGIGSKLPECRKTNDLFNVNNSPCKTFLSVWIKRDALKTVTWYRKYSMKLEIKDILETRQLMRKKNRNEAKKVHKDLHKTVDCAKPKTSILLSKTLRSCRTFKCRLAEQNSYGKLL